MKNIFKTGKYPPKKKKYSSTSPSIPYSFDTGGEAHPVRQNQKPWDHDRSHGLNPEPLLVGTLHNMPPNLPIQRKSHQRGECEG